jgi:hypothetical protein
MTTTIPPILRIDVCGCFKARAALLRPTRTWLAWLRPLIGCGRRFRRPVSHLTSTIVISSFAHRHFHSARTPFRIADRRFPSRPQHALSEMGVAAVRPVARRAGNEQTQKTMIIPRRVSSQIAAPWLLSRCASERPAKGVYLLRFGNRLSHAACPKSGAPIR